MKKLLLILLCLPIIRFGQSKQFNLQEFENKYGVQMFDEDITSTTFSTTYLDN